MKPSANSGPRRRKELSRGRKKTADAIHHEVAQEVERLLQVIFRDQRQTGRLDLEAVEMAVRSTVHRAGAAALAELLQFPAPTAEPRTLACPCGRKAHYGNCALSPC